MPTAHTDQFYRTIADKYRQYANQGRKTNALIAQEYKVSVANAAGWVKRARKLGLLEPYDRTCWKCHQILPDTGIKVRAAQVFHHLRTKGIIARMEEDAGDYIQRCRQIAYEYPEHRKLLGEAASHFTKSVVALSQIIVDDRKV